MRNVFVYRFVELTEGEKTGYGTLTRYEMALSRKKGYEEAVFGEAIFCTYTSGPLLLYLDNARAEAFGIAHENRVSHIQERSIDGGLRDGLLQCGINSNVAKEAVQRMTKEVGVMANPANIEKFHYLRVSLYKGNNNWYYEYGYGRWRYGRGEDMYGLLARECESWGRNKK